MSWLLSFYRSAVGKKALMAVTGIVMFVFVLGHLFGNLKIFMGPEKLNHYAEWLREMGTPLLPHSGALWIARAGLLACVAVHITAATQLTLLNWGARPKGYERRDTIQATYASRTMIYGGVIVALYVLFHLAHLTWGWQWAGWQPADKAFIPGDVYHNVVAGFSVWWVSAIYIVANLAVGLHLYHGLWSMFQSLGWQVRSNPHDWRRRFAQVFAVIITLGNISFPISVLTGVVSL